MNNENPVKKAKEFAEEQLGLEQKTDEFDKELADALEDLRDEDVNKFDEIVLGEMDKLDDLNEFDRENRRKEMQDWNDRWETISDLADDTDWGDLPGREQMRDRLVEEGIMEPDLEEGEMIEMQDIDEDDDPEPAPIKMEDIDEDE